MSERELAASDAVCAAGCCTVEAASLPDGGWKQTDKGWVLDPRRREHVRLQWRRESDRIDQAQARLPRCALCGQRAVTLDRFGLCSKSKGEHAAWRAEARREEQVSVR